MGFAGETTGTEGTAYGVTDLEGPNDPQLVLPIGAESRSIALRSQQTNQGAIFIGWDDGVTQDNGFPLYPEDAFAIDVDNTQQAIWAVSAVSGDQIHFIAVE